MLSRGAFTALLLLVSGASAVIVPPPTNVKVSCQNLKVTVSWEYSKEQPQTSFRVNISGPDGDYVSETRDHQHDVSHFIWESEARYMGLHYVSITAVQGLIQSEPVNSETFSFNRLKPPAIQCELDFPPVDLYLMDSGPIVSVINPLHYYKELKQAKKLRTATFKFTVSTVGGTFEKACTAEEGNCRQNLSYPEDVEEKCVSLTGVLFAGNSIGEVLFRKVNHICPSSSTKDYWILGGVLLSIAALVIVVVTVISFKTGACTMKPIPLPQNLRYPEKGFPQNHQNHMRNADSETTMSLVVVDEIPENISVSSEEDDSNKSLNSAGLYKERGAARLSDDSADDWASNHSEVQEERGLYECRDILVDVGDGEIVTAYSKRT